MTRVPVTILTGCLVAGKGPPLNRLMTEPGFGDAAVIVSGPHRADVSEMLRAMLPELCTYRRTDHEIGLVPA